MSDRIKMQMHDRNRKQPNALKHGSFTQMTILPGENAREFAKLHHAVREEWNPIGPTEEDAALTIAKGIWRKGRIQGFLLGKAVACSIDPTHPAYDEVSVLRSFCKLLEIEPDLLYKRPHCLSEEVRQHLDLQVPMRNFNSTSARARAIQKEITSVLLPALERVDDGEACCDVSRPLLDGASTTACSCAAGSRVASANWRSNLMGDRYLSDECRRRGL
jgi:hypothetical protein